MRRLLSAAAVLALGLQVAAQDKSAEVMKQVRDALGGTRLTQIKALSLEGPFAREMGPRQMQGTMSVTIQLPDRMHRSEETELPGGMSMERVSVLAGTTTWEDIQNRGGMGGGMQIVMRGPEGRELNPDQIEQNRLRRLRTEFNRYLLAFLGGGALAPTYVAVAEAPEGKADVLEVKNDTDQAVRLFVDQTTHMPLMLQYQETRLRMNIADPGSGGARGARGATGAAGATGAPDPEELRRRQQSMPPPTPSTVTLYLGDFKKVDGVLLPHRLTQAVDGKTVEEWTIEKVKVNPAVKADLFEKK